jgi:hypothetical protein
MSERYSYTATSLDTPVALPATAVANVFLTSHDLGLRGLEIGIGVANILDADAAYIEPYNGDHNPLPGPSREFLARLAYTLGF